MYISVPDLIVERPAEFAMAYFRFLCVERVLMLVGGQGERRESCFRSFLMRLSADGLMQFAVAF